ncbi:MAG: hypothetical protein JNJ54_21460 [Myxococcaceae bacterium]|nr:hypothetical protein [Myxococcaceae bacterium]
MRPWVVGAVLGLSGCTCSEKKQQPAPLEPAPRSTVVAPTPTSPVVSASWMQQVLTPTRMELAARIDYGPTEAPLTVQLELPPGLRVTRGRTFFTLEPTTEARSHVEPLSLASEALPVQDLALVVTAPGVSVREPYRFGRR